MVKQPKAESKKQIIMSKIGKLPITLPSNVEMQMENHSVKVTGPKGTLSAKFARSVNIEQKEKEITLSIKKEDKLTKSLFGTTRALLANMVKGVSEGWSKKMELVGTGYRAEVQGKNLVLNVGFSQPVKIEAPEGISFKVEKSDVTIEGINKELVGLIAARIRAVRPPEPYQGKGIRYKDEVIKKKAGKAAKAGEGA